MERLIAMGRNTHTWLQNACGLRLVIDDSSFRRRKNRRGNPTTEGRLAYSGPCQPPNLPKVKLDLTGDELLADAPVDRPISHPYSDAPTVVPQVRCYAIAELLAEKLRALVERCRPRDLYDVIHLHRHPDLGRNRWAAAGDKVATCRGYFTPLFTPRSTVIRSMPTFSTLLANYPDKHAVPTKALLDSIGGQVRASLGDAINTCAIRMSWALNKSGAPIRPVAGVSVLKGAPQVLAGTAHHSKPEKQSDLFIFRVLDVKAYLTRKYGPGRAIYDGRRPRDLSKLKGGVTQGIVAFEWQGIYRDFGASGHVDLFRVTETSEAPPRLVGACAGECFFVEGPMIAHLWETRP